VLGGFLAGRVRSLLLLVSMAASLPARADLVATASWPVDGVGICPGPDVQGRTAMVPDGTGGVFITWRDARAVTHNIYVVRITGAGGVAGGWPACGVRVCADPGNQDDGTAITDGHGGVIVLWEDDRYGQDRVFAQRVNAAGSLLWGPTGVPIANSDSVQYLSGTVPDGHGGAILTWLDTRRAPPPGSPHSLHAVLKTHPHFDLFGQRLNADGAMQWDPGGVPVCADSGDRNGGILVGDGAGGVIVAFDDGVRVAWYGQHLSANGARQWAPDGVPIQPGQAISDDAGGAFITWSLGGGGGNDDVWLQHMDAEGNMLLPPGGAAVCTAVFDQRTESRGPSIASDGAGGMFITWHDLRNGLDWDIYAQHMLASGAVAPGWPANGIPVCALPGFQIYPAVLSDGAGGAIITWYDNRSAATGYDVYAQRITSAGAIAPGWPVNGVALCTAPGDQVDPVPVTDGAGGMIAYWDDYRRPDVDIYAQHVAADGTVGSVATGVELPGPPAMSLEEPRPNPSPGEMSVAFSLTSSEPATITLYDVAGRAVVSYPLRDAGPGRHTVHLEGGAGIPSGIYVIRLAQGARTLTRRVAVLR
jgi:hypothetical protein